MLVRRLLALAALLTHFLLSHSLQPHCTTVHNPCTLHTNFTDVATAGLPHTHLRGGGSGLGAGMSVWSWMCAVNEEVIGGVGESGEAMVGVWRVGGWVGGSCGSDDVVSAYHVSLSDRV